MSEAGVPAPRRPSILLIVSLCLNVALIGWIAITLLHDGDRRMEAREGKAKLSAQMLMRIVPAERDKIEAVLARHRKALRTLRGDALQARAKAMDILTGSDFTNAGFADALKTVEHADAALQAETMALTAESVAVLTPAEREDVAQKMRRPGKVRMRRFFARPH